MFAALHRRITFANVVSLLALFVALGGTSYAVFKLPKNSVRSKTIKNGQVKRPDIAAAAVDSSRVADGTLLKTDFASDTLTKGDRGPIGPTGPTGTVDNSNFYDKAASDSRFLPIAGKAADADLLDGLNSTAFPRGFGKLSTGAEAVDPDSSSFGPIAQPNWETWYSCPDPVTTDGTIHFKNKSAATVNVFVDNGGANPLVKTLAQDAVDDEPAAKDGEAIDFDVQGFPGGAILHLRVLSVHRPSVPDCHVQAVASEITG